MSKSIYKDMIRGTAWAVSMRWIIRCIGLINIIILARILEPEDFGLVAMGTIIIGLIRSFANFGAAQLIIREQSICNDHINTAWTVSIIQGVLIALILVMAAPFAANYYDEPRTSAIIYFLSITALISGFRNIGITLARKELNFALDFRYEVYCRLSLFITTLVLALSMQNYWALIYSQVVGGMIAVIISYAMHPYRPRLCNKFFGQYFTFSLSIVPMRVAKFINDKADSLIVGGISGASQLGIYNTASDLSKMMSAEIAVPIGRALFPTYSKINNDKHALSIAFCRVLSATSIIIVPLGLGLGLIADDFVYIVLGEKWLDAVFYIKWLVIYAVAMSLVRLMNTQILIAAGYEKRAAIASWFRVVIFVTAILFAANYGGVEAIAMACTAVAIIQLPIAIVILTVSLPISVVHIVSVLWRPFIAGIIMTLVISEIYNVADINPFYRMISAISVAAIVYSATVSLLWYLAGRPDGVEQLIYQRVKKKLYGR